MITPGLFDELRLDPKGLGYAPLIAASNDAGVANLGNVITFPVLGKIADFAFMAWCAQTGARAAIQVEADNVSSPFRSSALTLLDVLVGRVEMDFSDQRNVDSLSAWVASGKISAPNQGTLLALATTQTPRNVILFGRLLSANDIAWVVRDSSGTKLI